MEVKIIDTPWDTSGKVDCFIAMGIETIIRYYCKGNSTIHPEKRLQLKEAKELSKNGIKIMAVYQNIQNQAKYFSLTSGLKAGLDAAHWAKQIIGQPIGSAIYFAIDYDADLEDLKNHIVPFFKGVKEVIKGEYSLGAYGSGFIVNSLFKDGLINYRWISESSGFMGTKKAINEGSYELRQVITKENNCCNISCDYNLKKSFEINIGDFNITTL